MGGGEIVRLKSLEVIGKRENSCEDEKGTRHKEMRTSVQQWYALGRWMLWPTKTTALFGWMGITGIDKQQQCEAFEALGQKMELTWAYGNVKLGLKLFTTLKNSMDVTETQRG